MNGEGQEQSEEFCQFRPHKLVRRVLGQYIQHPVSILNSVFQVSDSQSLGHKLFWTLMPTVGAQGGTACDGEHLPC